MNQISIRNLHNNSITASNHAFSIASLSNGSVFMKGDLHLPSSANMFKGNTVIDTSSLSYIPDVNGTYDLGAVNKSFKNLFIEGHINFKDGPVLNSFLVSSLKNQSEKNYTRSLTSSTIAYTIGDKLMYPMSSSLASHSGIIDISSNLYMWGQNNLGQLGDNMTTNRTLPFNISSISGSSLVGKSIIALALGYLHTIALDNNGHVHAWGYNSSGQLGNNTTVNRTLPINISSITGSTLIGKNIVAIACGSHHTLALDSSGQVHTWGSNGGGRLGNNATTNRSLPINISSISGSSLIGKKIVAFACGDSHTIALDNNGQVHAWGYNLYGQLGNNATTNRSLPITISSIAGSSLIGKNIIAIACCSYSSIALDSNGHVHAWGWNNNGQLGNNTTTSSSIPINISTISGSSLVGKIIIAIACGGAHILAMDTFGQLHAWGYNSSGQLGNNTNTDRSLPINISSISGSSLVGKSIVAIACGGEHTIALDGNGQLHAWGNNSLGQLGNNTTTNRSLPINIGTYSNGFINFTGQHRCFLKDISNISDFEGRIVVCDNNTYVKNANFETGQAAISINEALPIVSLSTKPKDKRVFGVISLRLNDENKVTDDELIRLREQGEINSLGEGAIWVTNANGIIESGDFISSSVIPGYGQRQDEEFMCNFMVAKSTMDCDFTAPLTPVQRFFEKWEDILESDGSKRMEPAYLLRFIDLAGKELTKEEYEIAQSSGQAVYKAAFIGCTYHCG